MWKEFLFNAVLFWVVSYIGRKNNVSCFILAVVFAGLHHVLKKHVFQYEFFDYMPDSRVIPKCLVGTERGRNGMDCKSQGDIHGL